MRPLSGSAPSVTLITAVAGTAMVTVVVTSLGLLPLFGEPSLTLVGWREVGPDLTRGVAESLLIAVPASALAAVVGTLLAALMLRGGRGGTVLRAGALAVLAVPHVVGATSIGLLLADGGMASRIGGAAPGTWPALVGGQWPVATVLELAWKESAFVALVVLAAVGPGHRRRSEVAAGLGAGPFQRSVRVLLPTAAPAIAASSLVTLVYAIGSYEVAWLLGRASPEPLPVLAFRLFGSIELVDRPSAAAAATVAAALSLGIAVAALAALPRVRETLTDSARGLS